MSKEQRREQITVPLSTELRAKLEQAADAEHRSVAGYIRHVLARDLEQQQTQEAAA